MRPDLRCNKLTERQIEALAHSYQSGHTVAELEAAFGVSHATIYTVLRRFGVTFNRPSRHRKYVTANGKTSGERINEIMREESEWTRERARIARQRTALPRQHGICTVCGQPVRRGESYGNSGNGVRHLRDCLNKSLEQARRYGTDTEMGDRRVRMAA